MVNRVNSWDEFQPLEEVLLGSVYDSSFFDDVRNPRIRGALKRIIDETQEDLDLFKDTMRSHGIKVYQASPSELGYGTSILDYVNDSGELGYNKGRYASRNKVTSSIVSQSLIPNPPLQPRDDSIVMGNRLLVTAPYAFAIESLVPKFIEWFGRESVDTTIRDETLSFSRSDISIKQVLDRNGIPATDSSMQDVRTTNRLGGFCSPTLTRIGSTCLVDTWQVPGVVEEFLSVRYPEFNYKKLTIGGHNDCVFSVLKPNLLVASRDLKPYQHLFNGWEIIWFDDPKWDEVRHWRDLRTKNMGKWWVPGEEENDEFTYFVERLLGHWTGYVEETIFDVNCLVLDDRHVVVNTGNPYLIDNLRKHGMEPVICPLRHSFFWDGGWHCLTLDIRRRGGQVDYGV